MHMPVESISAFVRLLGRLWDFFVAPTRVKHAEENIRVLQQDVQELKVLVARLVGQSEASGVWQGSGGRVSESDH